MLSLPTVDAADEYPPLSALNDLLFCPRRCFLHRVEGVWLENAHTLTGSHDHRRVHETRDTESGTERTARGLRLISHTLRLQGVADLVEFSGDVALPVEYKRGRRRKWDNDDAQLCAQAICLEEMLGVPVPAGAIFHVRTKRRRSVEFTPTLRAKTKDAAARLHALIKSTSAPAPIVHPKCKQCSVHAVCLPDLLAQPVTYQRAAADLFRSPSS